MLGAMMLVLATSAVPTFAQASSSSDRQVLEELRQIRQLLERLVNQNPPAGPAPTGATPAEKVTLRDVSGHAMGRADAPVTIVEFTDLQCPFCGDFHTTTFEMLMKDYILTGKVRYISRDLPLPMHPLSTTAARAARCAGEQGQFWEMRHAILINNSALRDDSFGRFARELGLETAAFSDCISDATRFDSELRKDREDASTSGITGTPSFVIGLTNPGPMEGVRIVGAIPSGTMEATLKTLLKESNERP
jgi:protein-disulfide isomerase